MFRRSAADGRRYHRCVVRPDRINTFCSPGNGRTSITHVRDEQVAKHRAVEIAMTLSRPCTAQRAGVDRRNARERARTVVLRRGRDGQAGFGGRSLESSHRSRGGRSRSRPARRRSCPPAASRKEVTMQICAGRCPRPARRSGRRPAPPENPKALQVLPHCHQNGDPKRPVWTRLQSRDHVLGQAGGKIWGEARGEASHRPRAAGPKAPSGRPAVESEVVELALHGTDCVPVRTECLVNGKLLRECRKT